MRVKRSSWWLGISLLAAIILTVFAPSIAGADVVAKGSWEIHQDEFPDSASDLHFTIYQKENWVYIKDYEITVTLLDPCPLGSNFTSSSFFEHDDGHGDGKTHAIDCEFWDGFVPFCCRVRIDARLTLNKWNTVRIKDIVWTQDDPPDTTGDDLPDNGWTACKAFPDSDLVFTFYNDGPDPIDLVGISFYTEGTAEISGDHLWLWGSWSFTPDPPDFQVAGGGSVSINVPFNWGFWLYFRAGLMVGTDSLIIGGQHQSLLNQPTYVDLASFDAVGREDHIELTWVTATELDNAGFNVRRGLTPDGDRVRVNHEPIAAQGDVLGGGSYAFSDYEVTENVTYYYWLEDVDMHGNVRQHGPVSARLSKRVAKPVKLFLAQNTPNPFSSATDIRFGLPEASAVKLTITDLSGRAVRTLVGGNEPAGYRTVHWDGRNDAGEDVAGGVYFCVLEAGKDRAMTKMVLTK
jgi:hypothetical protein